jgi:hypothetical protein
MRSLTYLIIATVVSLAACAESPLPTDPTPSSVAVYGAVSPVEGCPTFAEACDIIGETIWQTCGPDTAAASQSEYRACIRATFDAVFASFADCFSNRDRVKLRQCSYAWVPGGGGELGGGQALHHRKSIQPQVHEEPRRDRQR